LTWPFRPPLGDGEGLTVHPLVQEPMRIVVGLKWIDFFQRVDCLTKRYLQKLAANFFEGLVLADNG
jgi:hypothetical protein